MKILVTGGAGYIGSVATEKLLEAGHSVVVIDNLSQGHRAAVHPEAEFVHADLADASAIHEVFRHHRPQAVMHFASKTLVGESMEDPFLYLGDNVINAINLLKAMDAHDCRRIILSSTANLFDRPLRIPITPDETVIPGSPYGESKAIIERMLHWLDQTRSIRSVCLRYFNAAGATIHRGEDHSPEFHLIPIVLQVALGQREGVKIFGDDYDTPDGTCVRDYIHIADLARAHILALGALDGASRSYNLGNGAGFSVLEVIETARRITGHPIPAEVVARRPGDPARLIADSTAITNDLGWKPDFPSLESIIQSAWDWHQTHPLGYED